MGDTLTWISANLCMRIFMKHFLILHQNTAIDQSEMIELITEVIICKTSLLNNI